MAAQDNRHLMIMMHLRSSSDTINAILEAENPVRLKSCECDSIRYRGEVILLKSFFTRSTY